MAGRTAGDARAGAPGPVLPGYTILTRLAQGGTATVYVALQEALDRRVAVKVINRPVDDPKVWRDFDHEARAIARLSGHPNVVTVYTVGRTTDGRPFLVTELLDEGSLGHVVNREGPLSPAEVARVGVAVASALSAAHGRGILHRDVKPGNVLLGSAGQVKLGDFGIAKLVAGQSTTTTGTVAFTPEHVAPEILRGEPEGPWCDVYSLASTLAMAATGASLFAQRPAERIEALLTRKIMAPPPSLAGVLPATLAEPLARALDPDPQRRPNLPELRRLLAAADSSVAPAPPPIGRPWKRRLLPMGLAAAVLVAAALAWLAIRPGEGGSDASAPGTVVTATPVQDAVPTTAASMPPATSATTVPTTVTTTAPTTMASATPTTTPSTVSTTLLATPTTPATTPPPTPATTAMSPSGGGPRTITASEAESFIRSYYELVAASDYEASWAQLAPEFQRGKARSWDYYTGFWENNDIEVGSVAFDETTDDRAVIRVELRWNGSPNAVTDEFVLRRGVDGRLLIAEQSTVEE